MNAIVTVLATVLIFGLLIFIHELGHYIAARSFGVGIKEFAIGMGPKLFSKRGKYNVFSVRAFPIGGFVSMIGEYAEDNDEDLDDEDKGKPTLNSKPIWQRIIICIAGPLMNIILGIVVMSVVVISSSVLGSTTVAGFRDNSLSDKTGLQVGDQIVEINGRNIHVIPELNYAISVDGIEPVDIVVLRDGREVNLQGVKFPVGETKGVKLGNPDFVVERAEKTFGEVAYQAYWQSIATVKMTVGSLIDTFKGRYGFSALSGPVGIGEQIGEVVSSSRSFGQLMSMIASMTVLISMSLGIFNLLPVPVLDGGRILFYIIEAIRKKPMSQKTEAAVSAVCMILLLALMAAVTVKDIAGLF